MIVYNKLGDYLKSKNMKYIDLQRELKLSPSMTVKFTKNRTISTDTLNKVCEYLHVQPGEIMEWIYHILGKSKERVLLDDEFLVTHFMLYFAKNIDELEKESYKDWDSMAILKRGLMLIAFLNERWGIRVGNGKKDDKYKFLGLQFLI